MNIQKKTKVRNCTDKEIDTLFNSKEKNLQKIFIPLLILKY